MCDSLVSNELEQQMMYCALKLLEKMSMDVEKSF